MAKTCQRCGTELRPDVPGGFCPRCLVQAGIELSTGDALNADASLCDAAADLLPDEPDSIPPAARVQRPASALAGRSFGDYELLEEIAHGGMGVVYKARQKSLDRIVALKLLLFGPHAPPESVKRFRAEAVATAALQHPNIVAIHEVGFCEGQHFLVMDLVAGPSLARLIGNQPLLAKRAAGCVKTIAEAIHYAHERGILHRDLKPSNVLMDASDQPRVTDFGLAKRLLGDSELTVTGQVLGSPNYMPPEQATGKRATLSRRSDVYALGAILYHALTGRPPFVGEGPAETVQQVLNVEPVSPRVLNPSLPADLETVCLKCLEKEPGKRYATAQMLAEELGRFLEGKPVLARPVSRLAKAGRWCRRNPRLASAMGVALLSLLIGLVGVTTQWRRAESQRARAETGELLARRNAYVLAMNAAQQAVKANNPGRALELLNRQRPGGITESRMQNAEIDLRGFEWRYLWQQCQSEAAAVVGKLPSGIRALEVSPDGRWLVAGSEVGAVKVWNLGTNEEISLGPNQAWQSFAAFSPDSRLLVFSDQGLKSNATLHVWNTQTRERRPLTTEAWSVGPMAFSPDGNWFGYGACGLDFRVKVVVLGFPSLERIEIPLLTRLGDDVHGFDWVFTHDSRSMIYSERDPDRRIGFWDFRAGTEPQHFTGHREAITAMAISPDGQTLATGAGWTDHVIKLWEVPSFRLLGEFAGHEGWITSVKFSPDGQTLASASADRTIRLWDVPTRLPKRVFQRLAAKARQVCFAPDGQSLFSGTSDGWVHRWSLAATQMPLHCARIQAGLASLTVTHDGKQFAGIRQGGVFVGEVLGAAPPAPLPELGTNNTCLRFSCDGQYLFAGTGSGEVQVWSLERRQVLAPLRGSAEPVIQLEQDRDSRLLVVGQRKSEVQLDRAWRLGVWATADWQQVKSWTVSGGIPSCAVSPDGRWLATGHYRGDLQIWSLVGLSQTNTLSFPGQLRRVAFSPDGRLLAAASSDGAVKVWEMPSRRELVKFRAHVGALHGMAFSADAGRLATAGYGEEAVKLWDVATWQELINLPRDGESVWALFFNTEGNQLLGRNSSGDVLLWRVPSFAEIEAKEMKANPL